MKFAASYGICRRRIDRDGGAGTDVNVKIGVLTDMSSLYADDTGAGSVAAAKMAIAGFQSRRSRHEGRSRQRRSSEQAGHRLQHCAAMVRRRRRRRHRRRAEFRRGACRQRGDAREEQGFAGLRRGDLRSHRTEMLAQHRALDLRHLDARPRHRRRAGEDRRRHLVFPHRRLCVRPRARTRRHRGRPRQWRQGARQRGHPLNNQDFSSFLLQAQQSKAKIIGLANAGGDTINSIKQGAEFGITAGGQHFAALLFYIGDVEAVGLKVAQGLVLTETFYWDMNDGTRAWASAGRPSGRANSRT